MNKSHSIDYSGIESSIPTLPNPELSRIFFHSLMLELSQIKEEIGDYTAKDLVFKALMNVPDIYIEWGDPNIYGKNRMLVNYKEKIAVMDTTPIQLAIKLVWNTFIQSRT